MDFGKNAQSRFSAPLGKPFFAPARPPAKRPQSAGLSAFLRHNGLAGPPLAGHSGGMRLMPALASHPADNARALQGALDRAGEAGGGTVTVPPGRWESGPLDLRSGVTLELGPASVLAAATDLALYPEGQFGHNKDRQPYHFLLATDAEAVGLRGPGEIDGQGLAHWQDPLPPSPWYREKSRRPSPLLEFRRCRGLRLEGFTVRNSPGWTIHPFLCDDVRIDGVVIENHLYGPNTDGIDLNGCRHVHISNCRLHCGDDAVIIKATRDCGRPTEYVTVTNCVLESHCAAVGLGAETFSSIRHVAVSNCVVRNSIRMIQIILWDGGTVEHATFSNLTGRSLTALQTDRAIHFDVQQHQGENPVIGTLRHILCSNLTCVTRGRVLLTAQDGATMEDIVLRDVLLDYPEIEDPAVTVPRSRSSQLSNFSPAARVARAALVADNVRRLQAHNVAARWPADAAAQSPRHGGWFRRCDGLVDCPLLDASQPGTPRWHVEDSPALRFRE